MKMIIHDLKPQEFAEQAFMPDSGNIIISDNGTIRQCIGCFGCWIKTPGKCVIKDDYQNLGQLMSQCDEIIIISKCVYGSYSPFIRNVFDRSISYLLPYFSNRNGETHHKIRYENTLSLTVHFYGSGITCAEQETAKALVNANALNFCCTQSKINFHDNLKDIREVLQ